MITQTELSRSYRIFEASIQRQVYLESEEMSSSSYADGRVLNLLQIGVDAEAPFPLPPDKSPDCRTFSRRTFQFTDVLKRMIIVL